MKKSRFLLVSVMVILVTLGLTACERSASTPPPGDSNFPVPLEGTQQPMDVLSEAATQTAIAQSAGAELPSETPVTEAETSGEETQPETEATQPVDEQSATPTATPAPLGDVPTYEAPDTYVLQTGEFPFCIARRFNVEVGALLSASGLSSTSTFYAGTTLTIPKNAAAFGGERALRSHPVQYTVQSGDTVYSIACVFGDVDPRAIEAVNNLTAGYTLSVGQVIQIP